ncbi:putative Rhodanese-like protein [Hyella patelloides LEGE 07179]|uniref:Putative Rhodanese-like protein n=1 Tax=Hyella patelloides LEGE 07179 TaxID=945734 RepID=A0A563VZ41_9CYAN|nr:rhodanese-like domain-containing protein [Hyella patelloides]VEP16732.1 putative Rhodanese-like protein [Hyella patelloides LEGE 07179]
MISFLFLKRNYWLTIFTGLFLLTVSCSQQTTTRSEAWKQQKITSMYDEYVNNFPEVTGITVEEFRQLKQQNKTIIVDVRSPEERVVSIIPGAISQAEFEQNIDRYKNYPIVAYCTIGYRSGKYAQKLLKQGLSIFNLEGSLLAWSHIDGELVNSSGETKQIHVYGKQWRLTADDYQSTW